MEQGFFLKTGTTCIPKVNRSIAINIVDVNGRSLCRYIVDSRMVVVEEKKCPTPCKKEGGD